MFGTARGSGDGAGSVPQLRRPQIQIGRAEQVISQIDKALPLVREDGIWQGTVGHTTRLVLTAIIVVLTYSTVQ